jgi:hypothetical protein
LHALDVRSAELSWRLTTKQTSPATAETPLTTPREGAMTEREAIEGYNEALRYADRKFFGNKLDMHPIVVPPIPKWGYT